LLRPVLEGEVGVGALRPPNPGRYATPLGWRTASGVGGVEALFKPLPRAAPPGARPCAFARACHLLICEGSPPLHTIVTVVPQPGNLETPKLVATTGDVVCICVAYKAAYLQLYNPLIWGFTPPSRRKDPTPSGPGPGNVRPRDHAASSAILPPYPSCSSLWSPSWLSSGIRGPGRPPRRQTTETEHSPPTSPSRTRSSSRGNPHRDGCLGGFPGTCFAPRALGLRWQRITTRISPGHPTLGDI
jgi:hypothetical protein